MRHSMIQLGEKGLRQRCPRQESLAHHRLSPALHEAILTRQRKFYLRLSPRVFSDLHVTENSRLHTHARFDKSTLIAQLLQRQLPVDDRLQQRDQHAVLKPTDVGEIRR